MFPTLARAFLFILRCGELIALLHPKLYHKKLYRKHRRASYSVIQAPDCRPFRVTSLNEKGRYNEKPPQTNLRRFSVGVYLSSRAASSQVLSA